MMSIRSVIKPPDMQKAMHALTFKSALDCTSLNTFTFMFCLFNVLPSP